MGAVLETILSGQLLFAALVTGGLYVLVAIGLNLVYGTMRLLNVAHGDLVMIGAYVAFWAFTIGAIPPPIAGLISAIVCAAFGFALYKGLLQGLLSGPAVARLEANSLLIFFGLSVVLQNLTALAFTGTPRGYTYLSEVVRLGNVAMTGNRLLTLAVAVAVSVGVVAFLRYSVFGLAIKAVIENRRAAAVVGVDVNRLQAVALVVGFAAAGTAGALVSMMEQISPFMGFPFTIAAFVVIILGGLGNITGGIAAALILGALETYGVALTSASWRSILIYGTFVAVLLVRPQGLLGGRRIFQ